MRARITIAERIRKHIHEVPVTVPGGDIVHVTGSLNIPSHILLKPGALTQEEAIEELERNSVTHFDPNIVSVFINNLKSRIDDTSASDFRDSLKGYRV